MKYILTKELYSLVGFFVSSPVLIVIVGAVVGKLLARFGGNTEVFSMDSTFTLPQILVLFSAQRVATGIALLIGLYIGGLKKITSRIGYFRERFVWKGRELFFKWVVGVFVVYLVGNAVLQVFLEYLGVSFPGLNGDQGVLLMFANMGLEGVQRLFLFFLVAIVGPFVEEVIFRGYITDVLMRKYSFLGVVFASIFFSVVHMERSVFLNLTFLALCLGVIYWKTNSMWYSFLFHVMVNGIAVFALWYSQMYGLPLS